jgi:acyl-CoA synthetase (NDP forming)
MVDSIFNKFFEPKSIMVVGVSGSGLKAGNVILYNIAANGYKGRIFPVNPAGGSVMGMDCYSSVADVPEVPDLTLIAVPSTASLDAVAQCAIKGATALVLVNAGFAEVSQEGAELENAILKVAAEANVRIMGPNTSGVTSTPWNFMASIYPLGYVKRGRLSCIAQTGNFATITMKWILTGENFGVCRVAGLGNRIDVDESEVLEYLGSDTATEAVLLYLEGIKNGRRFVEVARRVSRLKPIVAMKSGRTSAGCRAVTSHTASLAGDDAIVDSAFRQAGVVRISSYADMVNVAKLLSMQRLPKGNRVAVLSPSGAMGVAAADACELSGLNVARLSDRTYGKLKGIFPGFLKPGNPVDLWGAANFDYYEASLRTVLEDDGVDIVIAILHLVPGIIGGKNELETDRLGIIPELSKQFKDKTVIVEIAGDKGYFEAAKKYLEERSIPVFMPVEPGIEAVAYAYRCRQYMVRPE